MSLNRLAIGENLINLTSWWSALREPPDHDPEIEAALDELGARLAEGLLQEEISIAYCGEVWIMRRDGGAS